MNPESHEFFMNLALKEAKTAFQKDEVPVGAVIVKAGKILSQSHNLREQTKNPLSHAELLGLKTASEKLKSWRLEDCTLYVSLEPCLMCMGAILQARISHLIYACQDPKAGFSSYYTLEQKKSWKHKIKISQGIYHIESSLLLKQFFKKLRERR